ncbi:condensin complex subunit 3, variant [Blastomyces gilchristii SLH14081]|uniref:Condensin complex subunit 3 n=1 Tax=Blastomyces gilchristii (strain SLH14081) TaxID=559298 RepID=A0A179UB69_BLAGS|nr:condensin complex subunit 3 [Blastomyces gilchristii SLH14081]XP_031576537.1 condensin complex subunit 3, variant [Blastomyces gilchristii SLH14081]OAT05090.1 condensin complex subunit 3 [Blastomyces gilchristii SLH14081]OAT05091.1 condensin complex subunit 3, variant [Blastomyces gilchristii SLH14081]
MPARVSARASSATSTRKSSAPPAERSAPSVFIPPEPALPTSSPHLRKSIVEIFSDAQRSATGHRKLVVRLRKIQEGCCGLRREKTKGKGSKQHEESINDGFTADDGVAEKEFNIEVSRCMLRILGVKKTEGAADRVIKFLGTFLRLASERDFEVFLQGDPDETQSLPETPTSRLIFSIVSTMIPLLAAKERIIRYRTTQIVTHIVNSLDSVDDELYHLIRQGLVKRIRDKEPSVRVQAVMGLGRLAGNEDEDDESSKNDGAAALLDRLLDVLQNDTSAEVRRTLLLNLPLTPTTLPYLLERARDLDAPTRRALYSRLLPQLGDFRHLSLSMREKLLRWGIRDRDDNVKKAAGRLFYERWIEDCAGRPEAEEDGQQPTDKTAPPSMPALMELLERIDVVNSGIEGGIAHEAMRIFWEGRPDYREAVDFNEQFWESLTPETVFMARSFNQFCKEEGDGKYHDLVDEKIPEVTALAYYLHKYTASLLDRLNGPAEDERAEEETVECEFVVEQLLHICLTLDYSDEVGRRKMFALLRETLAVPNLPEEVTKLVVEALRAVCGPDAAGESEFCGVVLEAVAEVHDTIVSEDSFVSAKSEQSEESRKSKRNRSETPGDEDEEDEDDSEEVPFNKEEAKAKLLREIMVNMKCLYIAQCMLQNVEGNLQDNMHLVTMLNNLVVPAVRSHEAPIRERGLQCLGLCCLLDKTLAEENMSLFIHCYTKGHEALQETAIRILADILTTHTSILLPVQSPNESNSVIPPPFQKPLLRVFAKSLKTSSPPIVQTAAVTALAKLLLTGTLSPSGPNVPLSIKELNENSIDALLQALVLSFFHPRTRDNLALRQALTYFLPVYCHSRAANAQHMRKIAVPVVHSVLTAADDFYALEADEDSDGEIDESVGEKEVKSLMSNVVGMLAEWTDERRIVGLGGEAQLPGLSTATNIAAFRPSDSLHLALMRDVLQRLLGVGSTSASTKEEKKHLLSLLSKLHVPSPPTPPTAPSRSGSRVPDGVDDHESLRSSMRSNNLTGQVQFASDDDGGLPLLVKDLLDQAISSGVASDATGRNALVKAKNAVLKLVAAATAAAASKTHTSRAVSVTSAISHSSSGRRESGRSRGTRGMSREGSVARSVASMASMASGASVAIKRERGDDGESILSVVQSEAGSVDAGMDESRTEAGEGDDTIISRSSGGGGRKRESTVDTGTDVFTDAEG